MTRTISIFTFILFGFLTSILAQEKEDFKNKQVCFIINVHEYQSQKVSDSLLNIQKLLMDEFKSGESIFPPPPPSINLNTFNLRSEQYLLISSKKIVEYSKPRFQNRDHNYIDLRSLKYTEVSRDSLTRKMVNLISESKMFNRETSMDYRSSKLFPIVSENEHIVKTISGFNCYQVIMKAELFGTGYFIEAFVTDEIQLEYHPMINVKEYLNKFFPLYIKLYDANFPNESFYEYKFEMSKVAF